MVASASGAAVYADAREIECGRVNASLVGIDKIQEKKIVYNSLLVMVIGGLTILRGLRG